MLAEERFSLIMEQLNRKRTVTVQELCEALNTSESTIRRDLTELDRLGTASRRRRQSSSTPMILCSSMQAPPRWSWCVHWRGTPSKPAM